jgi:Ca-activated chloride channel homolog
VSFIWPAGLLLLLTVPLALGIYLRAQRRRRPQAVTYSNLSLLRAAVPRRSRWRRHVPIALLLVGLAVLAVASARPQVTTDVPLSQTTIILALDESGSMCSTDVYPDRLSAAEKGAREFVNSQPSGTRIGLVAFSGFAELAVAPTRNRAVLDRAIGNLSTNPGTAIGAAILQSLNAISQVDPHVEPVGNAVLNAASALSAPSGGPGSTSNLDGTSNLGSTSNVAHGPAGTGAATKPGNHAYAPDVIVLLTDGANNRGITPLQAVPYAVARGVRVYTIGYGTTHPGPLKCTPQQGGFYFSSGNFGSGGSAGGGAGGFTYGGSFPLVADLPPLQQVSRLTGAQSYTARDESQLKKVFADLPKHILVSKRRHEVSADFAALAALFALAAFGAAIRWSPRPS